MNIVFVLVCLMVAVCCIVVTALEKLYLNKVKYPRMVRECAAKKEAERLAANSIRRR